MTLILNEIYLLDGFTKTMIVSSADRRLTLPKEENKKKKYSKGKKLFEISHLNATVSYWGNSMLKNDKGNLEALDSWLPNFINKANAIPNMKVFAQTLQKELNARMLAQHLRQYSSGFHFAGYNQEGLPDFMHFSNCSFNNAKGQYENVGPKFGQPSSGFLQTNAEGYGWDGNNPSSVKVKNKIQIYRNGDIRLHDTVWKQLDKVFEKMFQFSDFKKPNAKNTDEVIKFTQFKFKVLGDLYQEYSRTKWIGGPYDVIVLRKR